MSIGLLIMRLAVGATLAAHGAQKLFGAFRGHGIEGTAEFLRQLGFRTPLPYAYLLGTVLVHARNGFFAADNGYELPLLIGAAATAVAFTGPGRWSLDHALDWHLAGAVWGLAALAIAAAAVGAVIALRGVERPSRRSSRRPVLH